MLFANLLGKDGVGTFTRSTRKNTVPFTSDVDEIYEEKRVVMRDGSLVTVSGADESEDIFVQDLKGEGLYAEKICPYTVNQLKDTEENPLIVVLTDSVKFYEGTPSLVKYVPISSDKFLLCLMYGACEFRCADGSYIPMSRNLENESTGITTGEYKASKLKDMSSSIDSESDYDMYMDMVNAVLVDIKNEYVSRYKTVQSSEYLFSTVNRDERRAYLENKKKQEAEEAERRREANKKFMEDYHKREAEEASRKKEDKRAFSKPKNVRLPKDDATERKVQKGSAGAQNFMAALRNLGYTGK